MTEAPSRVGRRAFEIPTGASRRKWIVMANQSVKKGALRWEARYDTYGPNAMQPTYRKITQPMSCRADTPLTAIFADIDDALAFEARYAPPSVGRLIPTIFDNKDEVMSDCLLGILIDCKTSKVGRAEYRLAPEDDRRLAFACGAAGLSPDDLPLIQPMEYGHVFVPVGDETTAQALAKAWGKPLRLVVALKPPMGRWVDAHVLIGYHAARAAFKEPPRVEHIIRDEDVPANGFQFFVDVPDKTAAAAFKTFWPVKA